MAVEHFRIGEWIVYPKENVLASGSDRVAIEPRAMETLEFLAYSAGSVVSPERLLVECWTNIALGDNPVHKAIAQLRKALGDNAGAPRYIETIRKRGYRLIAAVALPSGYRGPVAPSSSGWSQGSPFRGLDAFDADDAGVFFGRGAAVSALLRGLEAQWRNGCAFVLLVGASGSGKTSLLSAGLLPRLAPPGAGGIDTVAIARIPGRGPGAMPFADALAEALTSRTSPPLFEADAVADWRDGFEHAPERTVARLAPHVHAAQGARGSDRAPALVLIVDQIEDFFPADAHSRQRAHTVQLLSLLARSGCIAVVAACRSDAYPRLADVPGLLALKQPDGHVDLTPPSAAEIAEIIRHPAQIAALTFEENATGRLDDVLRDAAIDHPQCLPLLQHTLQQLYERREDGGRLSFAAYDAIGGFDGALLQHAERSIGSVSPAAQAALAGVLGHLVRYSANGEQIGCVAAPMKHFHGEAERELVEALVRNRMLVGTAEGDEPAVAIAHEALLRVWPRAAAWVADNRDDLRLRARLHASATRWNAEGRRRDLLLPSGRLLEEARDLWRRRADLLDGASSALVADSLRRDRQRTWLWRGAIGSLFALAVIALAGVFVAQRARVQAERDRARADGMVEYMLGDLTDRLEGLGRLDLLDDVADRILRDLRAPDSKSRDTQLNRSRVLRQLGKIRIARGAVDRAEGVVNESVEIAQALVDEDPLSPERLLNLGESRYWAGYLGFLRNDYDTALAQWTRYRNAAERASALAPTNPRAWTESSYALNTLGTLSAKRDRYDAALTLFERSVEHKRKALQLDADDLRLRADLADSLSWVARTLDRLGQWRRAQAEYAQAIAVISQVRARAPDDAEWKHREAILRTLNGQISRSLARYDEARTDYAAAVRLLDQIGTEQPERSDWARDRIVAQSSAGELALDVGDWTAAQQHFDAADGLLEPLVRSGATVQDLPRLRLRSALNRTRLADARGDAAAAAHLVRAQRLIDAAPTNARLSRKDRLLRAEADILYGKLTRGSNASGSRQAYARAVQWLGPEQERDRDRDASDLWRRLAPLLPADMAATAVAFDARPTPNGPP